MSVTAMDATTLQFAGPGQPNVMQHVQLKEPQLSSQKTRSPTAKKSSIWSTLVVTSQTFSSPKLKAR